MGSLSRIGGISTTADPLLSSIYSSILTKRPRLLNIHQVVGHSPELLRAQAAYAGALRNQSSIPRPLQEMVIIRIAQVNNSGYEESVHVPIAVDLGIGKEKVNAIATWRTHKTLFNEKEQAALAFVGQAAADGNVDDTVFSTMEDHFSKKEIVELCAIVGWYVGNTRFTKSLRIADEA